MFKRSLAAARLRYMLVYQVESKNSAYGQLLIKTDNYKNGDRLVGEIQTYADDNFPDAQAKSWKFILGSWRRRQN